MEKLRQALLAALRSFHPIKVDDKVLFSTLQRQRPELTQEMFETALAGLTTEGMVEVSMVKAPFDQKETRRMALTPAGLEAATPMEAAGDDLISPSEMEARLVSTYDSMKRDVEVIKGRLGEQQKALEKEMADTRKSIAEHDQFLKTYFARIVETIGVFMGIFGIVVVMMISALMQKRTGSDLPYLVVSDQAQAVLFVFGLPFIICTTMLIIMWIIKRRIIHPPELRKGA
jgi:DNA-binding HxlR family transcriptional regulator